MYVCVSVCARAHMYMKHLGGNDRKKYPHLMCFREFHTKLLVLLIIREEQIFLFPKASLYLKCKVTHSGFSCT